jgi:hypothetical protein
MGLFDDVLSEMAPSQQMTKAEAFAGVLLAAVASDGHISDDEAQGLGTITARMKLFANIGPDKFNRLMDRLTGLLKRQGVETLLDKCVEALPEELHETAFANACNLVLADRGIEDDEKKFLSLLQRRLGVEREQALTIFKVMVIKNKG